MARPRLPIRVRVGRIVRPLVCFVIGHRDIRIINHREICDKPWHGHSGAEPSLIFCFWCDSGELDKETLR